MATSPDAARFAASVRRARAHEPDVTSAAPIVAGVAWSLEATIVTRNPRDFEGHGVPVLAYG